MDIDASGDFKRVGETVEAAANVALTSAAPAVVVVDATQPVSNADLKNGNGHANGNGHSNGNGNGGASANGNGFAKFNFIARTDAPTCAECGSIMIPNGSCHKCINCGTTSGCS